MCVVVSVCLICAVRASCDACEGRGLRLWVRPDLVTEGRTGQKGSGSSCSCYSADDQSMRLCLFICLIVNLENSVQIKPLSVTLNFLMTFSSSH